MKKIQIIWVVFSFSIIMSLDIISAETTEEVNLSQCGCDIEKALKKGDWHKAYESAEKLIAASPDSPEAKDAYLWLGLYHKSNHDFPKSTAYYQKVADLFPNTWASAEASARTGCNYFKLNNHSKALEYFRKSASEAQTWQQRKYASTWRETGGFQGKSLCI